ncbi:MAG: DUF4421 domain-containing protein [Cytophagales bacterium]|nr:DUF4421 domain-containing protein [Cytophaga sp.]
MKYTVLHTIHAKTVALLLIGMLCLCFSTYAQQDTSYYVSYENKLTTRFYFSRKFTSFNMRNKGSDYSLNYQPNTTLNMGIGATYKWATLNLAYGFGFLNPNNGQGKTKYLDLQLHNYGQKFVFDMFGQFYRGFYLSPKGSATTSDKYYSRPDLRVNLIGTSLQYVFNNKRFSYRTSYLQNEWQKKSAGTFLLGVEGFLGWIKSDSSFTPKSIDSAKAVMNYTGFNFFDLGLNGGYAYTFVYRKNFFLTGSAAASLAIGSSNVKNDAGTDNYVSITPNTFYRVAMGYNSAKWAISLFYVHSAVRINGEDRMVTINTSNVRLNFVRRFTLSKKAKKYLKPIDAL